MNKTGLAPVISKISTKSPALRLNELKAKVNLENQEKQLIEKLTDVENAIINIKNESQILKENKQIQTVYNSLLSKKHKISEELKIVKNKKSELYN